MRFSHLFVAVILTVLFGFLFLLLNGQPDAGDSALLSELEGCSSPNRSSYGVVPSVFESLPPLPPCFFPLVHAYQSGSFTDGFFFDSSFYSQPEFYPNFESVGLKYWTQGAADRVGVVGVGLFPVASKVVLPREVDYDLRLFVHSSFGVRDFQMVRLEAVFQNPGDAQFARVSLDSGASEGFILGPTFPKFDSLWVRPINLTVHFSAGAPNREYPFLLRVVPVENQGFLTALPDWMIVHDATQFTGVRTIARLVFQPA